MMHLGNGDMENILHLLFLSLYPCAVLYV